MPVVSVESALAQLDDDPKLDRVTIEVINGLQADGTGPTEGMRYAVGSSYDRVVAEVTERLGTPHVDSAAEDLDWGFTIEQFVAWLSGDEWLFVARFDHETRSIGPSVWRSAEPPRCMGRRLFPGSLGDSR